MLNVLGDLRYGSSKDLPSCNLRWPVVYNSGHLLFDDEPRPWGLTSEFREKSVDFSETRGSSFG